MNKMGITNLEQNIRNKTTAELWREYNIFLEQGGRDREFEVIKKELKERGEKI